jgi:hypothetical protein
MQHDVDGYRWLQPSWRAETEAWIRRQLGRQRLRCDGPIEQPHVRPWSTVLVVPAAGMRLYFKATAPGMANDAAISAALSRLAPDLVLSPLAVSLRRAWMLLPDGGRRVREAAPGASALGIWDRLLPRYAEVQIALATARGGLAGVGALDRRLVSLPPAFGELIERAAAPADRGALHDLMPRFADRCAELATTGIPETLQHDDLHDGNVLVQSGARRIIDWGDASIAHPFATMGVTLPIIASSAGMRLRDAPIRRLRDAYLEPWSAYGTGVQLRRALRLALRVWPVARALTWQAALRHAPEGDPRWTSAIVADALRRYLESERRRDRRRS